eukprot:3067968-Alexandrium_andersonii.AAC.1
MFARCALGIRSELAARRHGRPGSALPRRQEVRSHNGVPFRVCCSAHLRRVWIVLFWIVPLTQCAEQHTPQNGICAVSHTSWR